MDLQADLGLHCSHTAKGHISAFHIFIVMMGFYWSSNNVPVTGWLALLTSNHEVFGWNPAGGGIQPMIVWCYIAQSLLL